MIDNKKIKIKGEIRSFSLPGFIDHDFKFAGKKITTWISQAIQTKNWNIIKILKDNGLILHETYKENIIVTVGRAVMAERLSGGTTYSGEINYGSVGIGASPTPTNGDTQLINEQFRKLVESQSFSDNISYIDFFFEKADFDTDVIGIITEFGNFIDGSASADSGQMWSYIATGGWTKDSNTSLFVSCQYTFS